MMVCNSRFSLLLLALALALALVLVLFALLSKHINWFPALSSNLKLLHFTNVFGILSAAFFTQRNQP